MREPWARARPHDLIAVPMVRQAFSEQGFVAFDWGIETDPAAMREAVQRQTDPTALLIRFRPDQVLLKPGGRTVLVEAKSEGHGYPNFAIEVDSYRAAMEWSATHPHVMFAFVDLREQRLCACWARAVPVPRFIRVPRRFDFAAQWERMNRDWPEAVVEAIIHRPGSTGSGTPYFLLNKHSNRLRPLDRFIREELG